MGIINLTPDSFSGDGLLQQPGGDEAAGGVAGGESAGVAAACAAADSLVAAGADILDIGAESTRPQAVALDADTEWQRLGPVLQGLRDRPWRHGVPISVDTRHAATARRALDLGVEIINDVSGLADPAMTQALAPRRCSVVVMHALTVPADPAVTLPEGCDVVAEVLDWKRRVTAQAEAAGLAADRLIYDPGLGFGKSALQSLDLVRRSSELAASGGRWLVGHSRKRFLTLFTQAAAADRDDLTLAFSALLADAGVHILRVHQVPRHTALFGLISADRPARASGWRFTATADTPARG